MQKEVAQAKAKKAAEAEEQQKKIADMMVEAQKKVRCVSLGCSDSKLLYLWNAYIL